MKKKIKKDYLAFYVNHNHNHWMMMFGIYWTLHTRVGARALGLYKNSTAKPL